MENNEQGYQRELILEEVYERWTDCMLSKGEPWEIEERGFDSLGAGDLIVRTAKYAVILQDWELLLNCITLLNDYKRWPDWLEIGKERRRELKKQGFKGFRSQRSMTRDPYIQTMAAIMLMEDVEHDLKVIWLKKIRVPFWMNRLYLHRYRRALIDPAKVGRFERIMLRKIKFREKMQPWRLVWREKKQEAKDQGKRFKAYIYDRLQNNMGNPMYVKHLHGLMAYTAQAKRVQVEVDRVLPHWNYVIKLMCEKPTMYLANDFIEGYVAKRGFQWSDEKWVADKKKIIPPEQKYKLDKDWLDYWWRKWNENREV